MSALRNRAAARRAQPRESREAQPGHLPGRPAVRIDTSGSGEGARNGRHLVRQSCSPRSRCRRGKLRLFPVRELERWLDENAAMTLERPKLTRYAHDDSQRGGTLPRQSRSGLPDGITARHRRGCSKAGQPDWKCGCPPRYQVQVWSRRDQRRMSRTFPKLAAAKGWKRDAEQALEAGELSSARSGQTVRQAGDALIAAMRSGVVRTRSGRAYKPSAIRTFESNLELHIYPALGPTGCKTSAAAMSSASPTGCSPPAERLQPSATRSCPCESL